MVLASDDRVPNGCADGVVVVVVVAAVVVVVVVIVVILIIVIGIDDIFRLAIIFVEYPPLVSQSIQQQQIIINNR